jgi:hypothetical protein
MDSLKSFFDVIPGAAWGVLGAIFGASIGFLATIIANFGNDKRLKIQLEHDAREKNIDRMNSLRREVYMTAITEMIKVSHYFGDLTNGKILKKNISSDIQGFYIAAAKLSLVASGSTQKAVNALGVEYSKLIFVLMQRLSPIREVYLDVELNKKYFNSMMADVKRVAGEITRFNETARSEPEIFSGLQKSFEFFMSQAEAYEQQRGVAAERFSALQEEFGRLLVQDMKEMSKLQVEVLISVRQDLGVSTDEAEMRKKAEQNLADISTAVDDALNNLSQK